MINNRQNRRRGRGGPRGNPGRGQPNRGNANQLLEKYKGLARDAQMQGDRVQAEYYLQFADHYFRVLEEINAQKEERQQNQQQQQPKGRKPRREDDEDDGAETDEPKAEAKPRRSRKPKAEAEGKDDEQQEVKPKRTRRKKSDDDAIAVDALPPAISNDEADAA